MRRIYIKEEVCIGCRLCEVYCQLKQSQTKNLVKAFKKESPRPLPRLRLEKRGAVSFSVRCQHCDDSPCVYACLTGALSRDPETGLVNVDKEKCAGCWTCVLVCPFGAIKRDTDRGKIAKCDACISEKVPVCVANCPNEALVCFEANKGQESRGQENDCHN
jgi:carbon-monoxide dehydrogenase iron sulfur subunit